MDKLRHELTAAHKRCASTAQELIDANHNLKKLQHRCSVNEDEIDEWRDKLQRANTRIAFLDDQCHEKDTTIQVLRDELQTLQIELIKSDEKAKVGGRMHARLWCSRTCACRFWRKRIKRWSKNT